MINKINHVGIAVRSIDESIKLYTDVLGLKVQPVEIVEDYKVRTAIIPVGESKIELLESTDPDGPIAKHIEERGEGMHHLALEISNIQDTLNVLAKRGLTIVDNKPGKGVENTKIAFLHRKETKVLIELVEPAGPEVGGGID
jgi:methylmalonyl-CoA epimerase